MSTHGDYFGARDAPAPVPTNMGDGRGSTPDRQRARVVMLEVRLPVLAEAAEDIELTAPGGVSRLARYILGFTPGAIDGTATKRCIPWVRDAEITVVRPRGATS